MLLLMGVSAVAHDVDGKWSGTLATPMGDMPVGFTFKADGAKLTGAASGLGGADIAIADGKVDGNKITFSVTLDFGGMAIVLNYTGAVTPSDIKFTIDVFGMPLELLVKKAT